MSARGSGLSQTLQAPGEFETRSVPASGDCFYDAMHLLLPAADRPPELYDAGAMRDAAADSLTEETFALYKMFAGAGVEDFSWLNTHRAPTTLDELKAFNRVLSPAVAVLLNEVNEPIATHEPGSKLQRGLVLKLPPQLAPARLIAKQSIASPLTPARPSRKNKPQRCSNCKGTGHKSRTCKWGKPASASIAATVNVAAAPPALLDNNALAMNTAAAAAR